MGEKKCLVVRAMGKEYDNPQNADLINFLKGVKIK